MDERTARRIRGYKDSIEMLKHYKRHTSPKDSDVRAEIQEEIDDLERWVVRLSV